MEKFIDISGRCNSAKMSIFQLRLDVGVYFVHITTFFTRNIQDTSNKLAGIICRPPEQIKFEYHDSNSLLWLEKSKKKFLDLDLDLDLVHSMPSRSLDGLSGILHGGQPVCKTFLGVTLPVSNALIAVTIVQ